MSIYHIELTTARGEFIKIQRESSMEEYVKMAVSTEFPGCRIHQVTKLTSVSSPHHEQQLPDYADWIAQQAAADPENAKLQHMAIRSKNSTTVGCVGLVGVLIGAALGNQMGCVGAIVGGVAGFFIAFFLLDRLKLT